MALSPLPWPGAFLELLGEFGEAVLVQVVQLVDILLSDHILEVGEELLDLVSGTAYSIRSYSLSRFGSPV